MKAQWTKSDERTFQRLLKRRRRATLAELGAVNLSNHAIQEYSEAIMQDYDSVDAWENFLNWFSPEEVKEEMTEAKEFFDGGDNGDGPTQPNKKG